MIFKKDSATSYGFQNLLELNNRSEHEHDLYIV